MLCGMTDAAKAYSKAEASRRLAEIAHNPRARELFRQLADKYESLAKAAEAEAAPSIVPAMPSETDQWVAQLNAIREP